MSKIKYPYFATLKELIIENRKTIDLEIADKLYQFHILPMQSVRQELGFLITASLKSGYRSRGYELRKGRSGNGQHTFEDNWENGSGAIDWTCKDFKYNKWHLVNSIIRNTEYTRIAVYNGFVHCDYKPTKSGKREVYDSDSKSNWKFLKYAD